MAAGLFSSVFTAFEYNIQQKFMNAANKGLVGATRQIEAFIHGFEKGNGVYGNPADTKAALGPVASKMRTALIDGYHGVPGYMATVEASKRVPSYRYGQNRLPGALLEALKSPSMAVATGTGIEFINKPKLDAEAKHWRRLNYGARGSAVSGGKSRLFPVYFDGRLLFNAGSEAQPRPAFSMPVGVFTDGTGRPHYGPGGSTFRRGAGIGPLGRSSFEEFHPYGKALQYATGGIVSANFIDAGFAALAGELPPVLDGLLAKWSTAAAEFPVSPVTTIA